MNDSASNREIVLTLADVAATEKLGALLAHAITNGSAIFLKGELGAGKTSLVRGLLRELGHTGPVKSPTYTLLEEYSVDGRDIVHFDLYRLTDPEELDLIGIRDYFNESTCCLIEWPERGEGYLPRADLCITLHHLDNGREVTVSGSSPKGREMIEAIQTARGQKSG
jgi:tRNA threonylcarbamoyladenosine biosynthesis protein TsaE